MTKNSKYDRLKRTLDIFGSGIALVTFSPLIGFVAIAVRKNLGSPVIFKQDRPGKDGEIFTLYKFRSMLDVDEQKGLISNEDRMTSFGLKLRSTSLDELPSLLNVFRGDMSFVGPRPLLVSYLEKYDSEQARRHEVRPGITGLAQVNGRNDLAWKTRFRLDVEYVDNRSFLLDLRILFKTVFVALKREGVNSKGYIVGSAFES